MLLREYVLERDRIRYVYIYIYRDWKTNWTHSINTQWG